MALQVPLFIAISVGACNSCTIPFSIFYFINTSNHAILVCVLRLCCYWCLREGVKHLPK
jgi:hypothetical protein